MLNGLLIKRKNKRKKYVCFPFVSFYAMHSRGGYMRETRYLVFKQEITNSFLKTVSAYANYGTGTILFGVLDNGSAFWRKY